MKKSMIGYALGAFVAVSQAVGLGTAMDGASYAAETGQNTPYSYDDAMEQSHKQKSTAHQVVAGVGVLGLIAGTELNRPKLKR